MNDRLDAFSRRLNDTASAADLQKIDKRLTQVEDDLDAGTGRRVQAGRRDHAVQSDVKDLQSRVDDLENQQQNSGSGGGGTTTTP